MPKTIHYNLAQLHATVHGKRVNAIEWGRGSGKSTIFGKFIKDVVFSLDRGIGVLVGKTYEQILTRTLPSTIHGLAMHGIIKDTHYVVGKKAPKKWGWPEPYMPPLKWNHAIHFWNGTVILMVSQDRPGTGRGINSDFVLGDEAALLDYEALQNDVRLTCRGSHRRVFRGRPHFLNEMYASTTPTTQAGEWMYQFEEKAQSGHPDYYYSIFPSLVNASNLPPDYFKRMRETLLPEVYDIEVMCMRKPVTETGFYPMLSQKIHAYDSYDYSYLDVQLDPVTYDFNAQYLRDCRGDGDLVKDQPLMAGLDFGHHINCMVVGQMDPRQNILKLIKNLFVLGSERKILDDLAEEFCKYYAHHRRKEIHLFYDATGNNHQANARLSLIEQFVIILTKHGWIVQRHTTGGTNPRHETKFHIWNRLLKELPTKGRSYPRIRINANNCRELILSMIHAPAKRSRLGAIQKNKASECRKGKRRVTATDLSDAADSIIYGLGLRNNWLGGDAPLLGMPALMG